MFVCVCTYIDGKASTYLSILHEAQPESVCEGEVPCVCVCVCVCVLMGNHDIYIYIYIYIRKHI